MTLAEELDDISVDLALAMRLHNPIPKVFKIIQRIQKLKEDLENE